MGFQLVCVGLPFTIAAAKTRDVPLPPRREFPGPSVGPAHPREAAPVQPAPPVANGAIWGGGAG